MHAFYSASILSDAYWFKCWYSDDEELLFALISLTGKLIGTVTAKDSVHAVVMVLNELPFPYTYNYESLISTSDFYLWCRILCLEFDGVVGASGARAP